MRSNKEYSVFTQKYVEVEDDLRAYLAEYKELQEEFKEIPEYLLHKVSSLSDIILDMNRIGEEKWSKSPKQLYLDGWAFWMKEDKELREQRYGS